MEPEDLLPHSHVPVIYHSPEPQQSISCLRFPVLEGDIKHIKAEIKKKSVLVFPHLLC
jgi:hypothetical protein